MSRPEFMQMSGTWIKSESEKYTALQHGRRQLKKDNSKIIIFLKPNFQDQHQRRRKSQEIDKSFL